MMTAKTFFSYFLYLSLLTVSGCGGCVSSRDAGRSDAAVAVEPGGGSVKQANAKTANSVVTQNTGDSNKPKADSPVKEVSAVKQTAFAHLKPEHAVSLKTWMAQHKEWEPAQESDYKRELLEYAKQDESRKNYHPYRAVGDFNRDGKEDFGIGLVDSKTRKKLAFAVFNAPLNGEKAAFFTDRVERDDIIIFNNGYLYIGPDYSDSGFSLEPRGNTYKVTSLFDEMP